MGKLEAPGMHQANRLGWIQMVYDEREALPVLSYTAIK